MTDLLLRFLIGGAVVSSFATVGLLFKPKTFAGLFGAAPSVALATIGMTVVHEGKTYASIEARSMIVGALAFFLYASFVSWIVLSKKWKPLTVTSAGLVIWFGASLACWYTFLR